MKPLRRIYWDACVFLAWLHEDWAHVPGVMEGIEALAKDVHAGRTTLFTSVMTKTQVLEYRLKPHARDMFTKLFQRRNVTYVNQDERISDLSHAIRNHYAQPPRNIKLSAEDCVHLATAILYKADCMYTLDGAGPRQRKNDLIPLNGNVMGHALRIEKPMAQPDLLTPLGRPQPRRGINVSGVPAAIKPRPDPQTDG